MFNKNLKKLRNDYTEDDIIKMMEFLIYIIFSVFGDMMLQHTIYNRKYNWNKENYSLLLTVYNNLVLSSSMTYQQILTRVTQRDGSNSWSMHFLPNRNNRVDPRVLWSLHCTISCFLWSVHVGSLSTITKKWLSFGSNWKRWKRIPEFLSLTHGDVTLNMWLTITGKMILQ